MTGTDESVPMDEVVEKLATPGPFRWSGRVRFPARELEGFSWPLTVLRGVAGGPTVSVVGGTHGAEYVGVMTVLELARTLEPAEVTGTLFLLPVLDLPAFWAKVPFVCPVDGKDPAACFPGDPNGTFTEVMCHYIWSMLFERSDAILDLHGGDICESLVPFTIMQLTGDALLDAETERIARCFELPHLVVRPPESSGRHLAVAATQGKVAIVAEIGGAGEASPGDVRLMREGVERALGGLGILREKPCRMAFSRVCAATRVTAQNEGVITYNAGVGAQVEPGQLLGRLYDLAGGFEFEIRAPIGGVILFMNKVPAAAKGTILFGIGHDVV